MAWNHRIFKEPIPVEVCAMSRRNEFAGFFLDHKATAEAIRNRDPIIFELLETLLDDWDGLCLAGWASDSIFWYYCEVALLDYCYDAENLKRRRRYENDLKILAQSEWASEEIRQRARAYLDGTAFSFQEQPQKAEEKRVTKHGYVYVLRAPAMNPDMYKIGREQTKNVRVDELGIKIPWDLELVARIESDDYIGLEAELHQRFADKRDKGEWFRLTEEDIEWIRGLESKKGATSA